jgi:hypothetical protein
LVRVAAVGMIEVKYYPPIKDEWGEEVRRRWYCEAGCGQRVDDVFAVIQAARPHWRSTFFACRKCFIALAKSVPEIKRMVENRLMMLLITGEPWDDQKS